MNEKWGDILLCEQNEQIQRSELEWRYTYVWKEKGLDLRFLPVKEIKTEKGTYKYLESDLETVYVFKDPQEPLYNLFEKHLNHYFFNVLTNDPMRIPGHIELKEITRIILPKNKLVEIEKLINEFNLESHRDCILYIVAKIQKEYVAEIELCEKTEERQRIIQFPKEIDKLITALDKSTNSSPLKIEDLNADLNQIRFRFKNKIKPIYIEDRDLLYTITSAVKKYLGESYHKDWKKGLEFGRKSYNENQKYLQFKKRLAKALWEYFINEKLFEFKEKIKIVDRAYCIARIIHFASVPIYEENREYDIYEGKNEIINLIKKWVVRTEIDSTPNLMV